MPVDETNVWGPNRYNMQYDLYYHMYDACGQPDWLNDVPDEENYIPSY